MSRPESIVRLPDGNFLVADTLSHEALTRINSQTGIEQILPARFWEPARGARHGLCY